VKQSDFSQNDQDSAEDAEVVSTPLGGTRIENTMFKLCGEHFVVDAASVEMTLWPVSDRATVARLQVSSTSWDGSNSSLAADAGSVCHRAAHFDSLSPNRISSVSRCT
jgi:hypothetical protein